MATVEELFRQGTLEMSTSPIAETAGSPIWSDFLPNKILMIISILVVLASLSMFISMIPSILDCFRRIKGSIELEHNISTAKMRSTCAAILAVPFCLMIDRYGIYSPDFFGYIPKAWHSIATMAVLSLFLVIRHFFYVMAHPRKVHPDITESSNHVLFTYFIPLVFVMMLTAGIFTLCRCPENVTGTVLLWETAACYILAFIRRGQILNSSCSGFSTFLYLCVLEIIPTFLLVASAVEF